MHVSHVQQQMTSKDSGNPSTMNQSLEPLPLSPADPEAPVTPMVDSRERERNPFHDPRQWKGSHLPLFMSDSKEELPLPFKGTNRLNTFGVLPCLLSKKLLVKVLKNVITKLELRR